MADAPLQISEAFSVKGKVAIVTGAAGIIGPGIAEALAVNGAKLVCSDRPSPALNALVDRLKSQGGDAVATAADLCKPDELRELVNSTVGRHGGLDILINCGGIPSSGLIANEVPEDFDRLYHTNVRSLWLLSKYCIEPMTQRGGGAIVNIASINGHRASFFCSLYTGTKAAVLATTRELAVELAPHRIRVNSVSPGAIADPTVNFDRLRGKLNEPWQSELVEKFGALREQSSTAGAQPLAFAGTKYDIAMACLYLCAPAARFVTGTDILVDGGKLHEMHDHEPRFFQKVESPWMPLRNWLRSLPDEAWGDQRPHWTRLAPAQRSAAAASK